jgi:hypothetical protein
VSKTIRVRGYVGIIPAAGGFEEGMIWADVPTGWAMGGRVAWPLKVCNQYDMLSDLRADSIPDSRCPRFSEEKADMRRFAMTQWN